VACCPRLGMARSRSRQTPRPGRVRRLSPACGAATPEADDKEHSESSPASTCSTAASPSVPVGSPSTCSSVSSPAARGDSRVGWRLLGLRPDLHPSLVAPLPAIDKARLSTACRTLRSILQAAQCELVEEAAASNAPWVVAAGASMGARLLRLSLLERGCCAWYRGYAGDNLRFTHRDTIASRWVETDPNYSVAYSLGPMAQFGQHGRYCEVVLLTGRRSRRARFVDHDFLLGVSGLCPWGLRGEPPPQAHLLQDRWLFECLHTEAPGVTLGVLATPSGDLALFSNGALVQYHAATAGTVRSALGYEMFPGPVPDRLLWLFVEVPGPVVIKEVREIPKAVLEVAASWNASESLSAS